MHLVLSGNCVRRELDRHNGIYENFQVAASENKSDQKAVQSMFQTLT